MIAVSFVRSAHDIRRVGTEPHPRGPLIVAKIETRAAVDNLRGIIDAAGAVMVARGDLANECSLEELPHLQKKIIQQCIAGGRPVITATQMLESMITSPAPTRAEASDVANAVFDGSSAVMLSAETAVGHDPVNAVRTMGRIACRADEEFDYELWAERLAELRMTDEKGGAASVTDTMTMAAWRPRQSSGSRPSWPSPEQDSRCGLWPDSGQGPRSSACRTIWQPCSSSLSAGGTIPILVSDQGSNDEMVAQALRIARETGHVRFDELVAVLAGADNRSRSANVLRLERVP